MIGTLSSDYDEPLGLRIEKYQGLGSAAVDNYNAIQLEIRLVYYIDPVRSVA